MPETIVMSRCIKTRKRKSDSIKVFKSLGLYLFSKHERQLALLFYVCWLSVGMSNTNT